MAHRKQGGSAQNLRDSNPKMLGVKLFGGQFAKKGDIVIRQRGTKWHPGKNIGVGKDFTLFAMKDGLVRFSTKKLVRFTGKLRSKVIVNIDPIKDKK